VPAERVNAALSLGASRLQLFTSIILPSTLPEILTGLTIAIGVGLFNVAELLFPKLGLSGEAAPTERSWDVGVGRGVRPKVAASAS